MGLVRCQFKLNGQAISQLIVKLGHRTIVVPAFSGAQKISNQPKHMCVPEVGAIPKGKYYIVDRQSGGRLPWQARTFNRMVW